MATNKSTKTPTLAELEEAYRVRSENLQLTLSDPAGDEMPDADNLPTSADDVEFAARVIIQAGLNLQYDALDWHKAYKALAAARTKVKRAACPQAFVQKAEAFWTKARGASAQEKSL